MHLFSDSLVVNNSLNEYRAPKSQAAVVLITP